MDNEQVSSFPGDEQPGPGGPLATIADSDNDWALSRFLVGLLLLGSDELAQGLRGTAQPAIDSASAEETSSDLLRHLALGLLARGERDAGNSLRTAYYASVGTASWTFHALDRLTDNRFMHPLRRPVEARIRRLGEQVAEIVKEGKREEQDSRALATESVGSVVENIFDQVAESEEVDRLIKELVGQKSVSFASSLVDNVRTLTAIADDAFDGALRRLLRRTPRRDLPPSPLEGQPQTMYASMSLVRGVVDDA
jgi:hypothetical protein